MMTSGYTAINAYSTVPANNGSLIGTITLPTSYFGVFLATDSAGQVYVAAASAAYPALTFFTLPPDSTGTATLSGTINVNPNFGVTAIAVDSAGRFYVAGAPYSSEPAADQPTPTVTVYSATANGAATPLRTLQLTGLLAPADVAVDTLGDIYVAGLTKDWASVIAVYPPPANGPSRPCRTIRLVGNNEFDSVAVDYSGNIFASVCRDCLSSGGIIDANYAIEKFEPDADGDASPIDIINLTAESPWTILWPGAVRVDGAGNIFTALTLQKFDPLFHMSTVLYGFGPNASGSAVPTVQITNTVYYNAAFALN